VKPIPFREQNRVLYGGDKQYSENVTGVDPLPIWTDGEQCLSCWQMSWRERLSALLFGRVWLALLSGETQPPAWLGAQRTYLKEVDVD